MAKVWFPLGDRLTEIMHMTTPTIVISCHSALLLFLATLTQGVLAGDGFPPYGAHVYGSRPSAVSAHAYHGHWHGSPVRGSRYGYVGYGHFGYGNFAYGRSYAAYSPYLAWGSASYYAGYRVPSVYRSYRSSFGPNYFYYSSPLLGTGTTYRTYIPYSVAVPYLATPQLVLPPEDCDADSYLFGDDLYYSVSKPIIEPEDSVENDSIPYAATIDGVPVHLLDAADAICAAGGFREAAKAYAELDAVYGPNAMLCGRRFVAQVASGDVEQAVVIAATAELSGQQILREDLPAESLASLGILESAVAIHSEALAESAYKHQGDADRLMALAFWLNLAGDDERAGIFGEQARSLQHNETQPEAGSDVEYVSLQ